MAKPLADVAAAVSARGALPADYVPSAESHHALYQIDIEAFQGPLDLLLFLCRRHQLDIFDIPMAFICTRYLEVLEAMQECSLDVAAEFMFMASELLHIKSRMLLPREPTGDDEGDEVDPRAQLVARLLVLQSFQGAATELGLRPQLGRDIFGATAERQAREMRPLKTLDAWRLIAALDQVLRRQAPEVRHRVVVEQVPMRLRMYRLLERLAEAHEPMPMEDAFGEVQRTIDVIVTFLAVLELAKRRLVRIDGDSPDELTLSARFASLGEAQRLLQGAAHLFDESTELPRPPNSPRAPAQADASCTPA